MDFTEYSWSRRSTMTMAALGQLFLGRDAHDEWRDDRLAQNMAEQRIFEAIAIDVKQVGDARPM